MIVSKQKLKFIDGDKSLLIPNQFIGDVPEWVTKLPLYKNAVACGRIIESGKKDKEIRESIDSKPKDVIKQEVEEKEILKETKKKK